MCIRLLKKQVIKKGNTYGFDFRVLGSDDIESTAFHREECADACEHVGDCIEAVIMV